MKQCWAMGPTGPFHGLHSWLEGQQEAAVEGTRVAAYQPRAGLQSDFGNPDELSII